MIGGLSYPVAYPPFAVSWAARSMRLVPPPRHSSHAGSRTKIGTPGEPRSTEEFPRHPTTEPPADSSAVAVVVTARQPRAMPCASPISHLGGRSPAYLSAVARRRSGVADPERTPR
jgi:hypothetical protein